MKSNKLFKKMNLLVYLTLVFALIKLSNTEDHRFSFREAAPITWKYTGQTANSGPYHYTTVIHYISPCEALKQFKDIERSAALYHTGKEQPKFSYDICQATLENNLFRPMKQFSTWWRKKKSQLRLKRDATSRRNRRSLDIQSFCTGCFLSNVVSTVFHWFWPSPFEKKMVTNVNQLNDKLKSLNTAMNASTNLNHELVDGYANLTEKVERLETNQNSYSQLAMMGSTIVNSIRDDRDRLHRLRFSFQNYKIDLEALSELLDTEWFADLDPKTAIPYDFEFTDDGKVIIQFSAERREESSRIFRVESLKIWNALGNHNSFLEYAGPSYISLNLENNCTKGVEQKNLQDGPKLFCNVNNYIDQNLSNWVEIAKSNTTPHDTPVQVIRGWSSNIVYCFPHRIRIEAYKFNASCPAFPFFIDARVPWVAGNFSYSYDQVLINKESKLIAIPDMSRIESAHLPTHLTNEGHKLSLKIFELRDELTYIHIQGEQ